MNLTPSETEILIDVLRRNFLYQTATRVWKNGGIEIERVNLAMMWGAYCQMMELIHKAGGFEPPKEARQELLKIHAEKAKDVGDGGYNLKEWSAGELARAIDEARGVEQLAEFMKACEDELKNRGN